MAPIFHRNSQKRAYLSLWMQINFGSLAFGLISLLMPAPITAQDISQPLGVIDWINDQAAIQASAPRLLEPSTVDAVRVPTISVSPLDQPGPKRVGLVPPEVTGLPDDLWSASDGEALASAVSSLPVFRLPALQQLTYTLLLAETAPPNGNASAFDLARVDALVEFGALDPAIALLEQAGPTASPRHFERFMGLSLLSGSEASACAALLSSPALSPGKAHEVFCHARAGDWNTAVLLLGTARVLELIPSDQVAALERFLDPDLFEDEPPLPIPPSPDPLLFRLYQAIGTPIPTRIWPTVYANADLAYTSGWKAQIEAAERLARHGALPGNQLIGLYTRRKPAASGGVWDRVAKLQRFETALMSQNVDALSKALPVVWDEMQTAELEVPFANLFADRLAGLTLNDEAMQVAFEVMLLSPNYKSAAVHFPKQAADSPALATLSSGGAASTQELNQRASAIISGFRDTPPDPEIFAEAQSGELGRALLETVTMADAGGHGDVGQLSRSIATLRALGFDELARRTALQVLLLDPN